MVQKHLLGILLLILERLIIENILGLYNKRINRRIWQALLNLGKIILMNF